MILSVIVPVYNAEECLSRCLESLLKQGVKDYEVICVNDGSTDGSLGVLETYVEQYGNIVQIINQPNGGVSKARNAGLDAARGDVIAFCDADDYLVPNAYRYLLEHHWNESVDVLKYNSVTLDTRMLKTWQEPEGVSGKVTFEGSGHDFYCRFRPCFVWANLYRKSFLDQNHLRFGQQGYAEDIAFSLDLFMCNPRCVAVDANVYRYTISEQQLTRCRNKASMHRMVDDMLMLFQKMCDYGKTYQVLKASIEEHKEQLMSSCISRILSADYDRKEWGIVKERLQQVEVLPMRGSGRFARVVNGIMSGFIVYKMCGFFYRTVFVPYVLPQMSRN